MTFQDLELDDALLSAVHEKGYTRPTPIQEKAIPHALAGRDVLGCAQTGTGKTAAFVLPILQQLAHKSAPKGQRHVRALVLTPTRELAIQIGDCCKDYSVHTALNYAVIYGGVSQRPQVEILQRGVDLLIATPGRLIDLQWQGLVDLNFVQHLVLDEADRMLDMGFINDIRRILYMLPAERQTLFFSATMPPKIEALAGKMLCDPVRVTVAPPASVVETISQKMCFVDKPSKIKRLEEILNASSAESVLVFSRTKYGADRIARTLNKASITSCAIHGNKSQGARERAMTGFRSGEYRVMVATDIAARGIDISELPLVVNYDLPQEPETYVHRIGRTGRAGCEGQAYSFCAEEEMELWRDIEKTIGRQIPIDESQEVPQWAEAAVTELRRVAQRRASEKRHEDRSDQHGAEGGKGSPRKSKRQLLKEEYTPVKSRRSAKKGEAQEVCASGREEQNSRKMTQGGRDSKGGRGGQNGRGNGQPSSQSGRRASGQGGRGTSGQSGRGTLGQSGRGNNSSRGNASRGRQSGKSHRR